MKISLTRKQKLYNYSQQELRQSLGIQQQHKLHALINEV